MRRYFWGGQVHLGWATSRPFHTSSKCFLYNPRPPTPSLPTVLSTRPSPRPDAPHVRRSLSPLRQASRRRRVRLFSGPSASACSPPSQPGVLQRRVRVPRHYILFYLHHKQRTPISLPPLLPQHALTSRRGPCLASIRSRTIFWPPQTVSSRSSFRVIFSQLFHIMVPS